MIMVKQYKVKVHQILRNYVILMYGRELIIVVHCGNSSHFFIRWKYVQLERLVKIAQIQSTEVSKRIKEALKCFVMI